MFRQNKIDPTSAVFYGGAGVSPIFLVMVCLLGDRQAVGPRKGQATDLPLVQVEVQATRTILPYLMSICHILSYTVRTSEYLSFNIPCCLSSREPHHYIKRASDSSKSYLNLYDFYNFYKLATFQKTRILRSSQMPFSLVLETNT